MRRLLLLLVFTSVFICASCDAGLEDEWTIFKQTYKKSYTAEEDVLRRSIWAENLEMIIKSNKGAEEGKVTYWLKINYFGDMTMTEIRKSMMGLNSTSAPRLESSPSFANYKAPLPPTVDWRKKGIVTKVKNQRDCFCSWAFAAAGSLEGLNALKTGKLVSLSEQNLIDCSRQQGNQGCQGGLLSYAFTYIADNDGIDTDASYPYEARNLKCRFNRTNVGATDFGFVDIPKGDEQALKAATALIGPIAAGMDADHKQFTFYKSGVLYIPDCSTARLNFAPLIAGYGTEGGKDYWLLKICFGEDFGDKGYVKLARNRNNLCGIASLASYPIV